MGHFLKLLMLILECGSGGHPNPTSQITTYMAVAVASALKMEYTAANYSLFSSPAFLPTL